MYSFFELGRQVRDSKFLATNALSAHVRVPLQVFFCAPKKALPWTTPYRYNRQMPQRQPKWFLTLLLLFFSGCVFQEFSPAPPSQDVGSDATADLSQDMPEDMNVADTGSDQGLPDMQADMGGLACSTVQQFICNRPAVCGSHVLGPCTFDCPPQACAGACVGNLCGTVASYLPSGGENLGNHVALAQGWILAGLPDQGSVRLIERSSGTPTDLSPGMATTEFGSSVTAGSASVAMIGAPDLNSVSIIEDLNTPGPPAIRQRLFYGQASALGGSVAVAKREQNTAVVSSITDREAYVIRREVDSWAVDTQNILEPPSNMNSGFGTSVAISPDGNAIVIGAPVFQVAYFFVRTGGNNWRYVSAYDGDGLYPAFGRRVAISDSHVAVAGDGVVAIFAIQGTLAANKTLELEELIEEDGAFGADIAFEYGGLGDGTLWIGAPLAPGGGRVVRLARITNAIGWLPVATLSGDNPSFMTQNFGASIAAQDGTVVIGAPNPNPMQSRIFEVTVAQ